MLSVRRFVFAYRFLIFWGLTLALLLAACGGTFLMKTTDPSPVLTTKSHSAVLVIIREDTIYHAHFIIDNFLDGKMIGQTQGYSFFVTEVKPGMHYLTSHAQNYDTVYMNFSPGKIYFLQQGIFPGYHAPTSRYVPMSFTEAKSQIKGAVYLSFSGASSENDMTEKDYQEEKIKYEKEVKEDPNIHKDTRDYQGFGRI